MAHYHVDGTLVVAKLKRRLIGGAVYADVAVRREDGTHRIIGPITALDDMKGAMVPGTRGRFYFYDVLGSKGIYGVRPAGGTARAGFPFRWELMSGGMGALNLSMALGWWLLAGSFAPFATALGILCLVIGAIFLRTRIVAMRDYRADDHEAAGSSTGLQLWPVDRRGGGDRRTFLSIGSGGRHKRPDTQGAETS